LIYPKFFHQIFHSLTRLEELIMKIKRLIVIRDFIQAYVPIFTGSKMERSVAIADSAAR
jgi:hypothetical protein